MELFTLSFLIASFSLLFACSWVLHLHRLQNVFISFWELLFPHRSRSSDDACNLPLPPGSFGLPWLGETLQFNRALQDGDLLNFFRQRTARFGSKTFKTHIFLHPTAVVQGASANRFLVTNENQHLLVNSWAPSTLRIVGSHAPPAEHGAAHRRLRQIMTACLGPAGLQKLVGKADFFTREHFATCWKGKSHVSLVPLLKHHTFRIACSLLASIEDEAVIARLYPLFITWIGGIVALPINLPGTNFHKAITARNVLLQEMGDLIERRQQDLARLENSSTNTQEASNGATNAVFSTEDLLSMLIKARDANGDSLNRVELQDVLLFLLFAGHDTTTAALAFALKFLEQNPACIDCLVHEHEAIASEKSPGEELKWTDVQEMKYTWRVIQETMRLIPPVFGGMKEATQDLTFDGFRIPKGWKMFFSANTTHRDEQYFLEPSKFDPSRFDVKNRQEKFGPPPFTYVPFGIGPHSCPGNEFARMTTSIYLHHLVLSGFTWSSSEPDEKPCLFPMPTLSKGYPIKITEKLS